MKEAESARRKKRLLERVFKVTANQERLALASPEGSRANNRIRSARRVAFHSVPHRAATFESRLLPARQQVAQVEEVANFAKVKRSRVRRLHSILLS